jgi:hypothetical protein
MTRDTADLELLRAYEPIVRYTNGELFFPTGVEGYVAECDLLVGTSEDDARVLVPQGELTTETLASFDAPVGESLYLRLVQQPLNGVKLRRWRSRPDRIHFSAPGRLARVGLFARLNHQRLECAGIPPSCSRYDVLVHAYSLVRHRSDDRREDRTCSSLPHGLGRCERISVPTAGTSRRRVVTVASDSLPVTV